MHQLVLVSEMANDKIWLSSVWKSLAVQTVSDISVEAITVSDECRYDSSAPVYIAGFMATERSCQPRMDCATAMKFVAIRFLINGRSLHLLPVSSFDLRQCRTCSGSAFA